MPYLGNSGQFSNIYEKNHATSTLRIIEGSAGYDPVGEDYTLNATLQEVTGIGATTTNTVKFNNTSTSLTTLSRVGIANATPSYKLSVGGAVHMDDASSNVIVANGSAYIESNLVVGNSNLSVDTVNGYVGINKVSPEYELDVVGDMHITGSIYKNGTEYIVGGGGSSGSSPWTSGTNSLYYRSNVEVGTGNLFVDTVSSNVGVGTTNPGFSLDVHGTANVGALATTSLTIKDGPRPELNFNFTNSKWLQQQKLTAGTGASTDDKFGWSVSISSDGSTAIVGAHGDDSDSGSAYIFVRSGSSWTQQAKLTAGTDASVDDEFGISVSISGDGSTAIVGARYDDDNGSAYIFVRSAGTWTQQQKLTAGADAGANDNFGEIVSISGDGNTAIVGARYDDDNGQSDSGSAYIFVRSSGTWTQQTKLTAGADAGNTDYFGHSVSISSDGSTAIVGAYYDDDNGQTNSGSAYIFVRSESSWTQQQKLTLGANATGTDFFGYSVSISSDGSTVIVGAYGDDDHGLYDSGAAYIFVRSSGTWTQQAKLTAGTDAGNGERFGFNVSISGDGNTAIVGAYPNDSAYIFVRSGGTWTQQEKLTIGTVDAFAWNVSISSDGNTAIVGSYGDNAYIFIPGRSLHIPRDIDVDGTAYIEILESDAISASTVSAVTVNSNLVAGNVTISNDLIVNTGDLVVDTTNSRVGINKSNPSHTLDVDGDINFTGTLYENGVVLSGYTDAQVDIHLNTSSAISGQVLSWTGSDYAWAANGSSDSTSVIAPVAFAVVNTTSDGSGTGISWGSWNSSNYTLDFTFDTAQSDTDYSVITDSETFDNYFVGISNKSTTGFRAEFYDDSQSREPSAVSPFTFIIYASTPTIDVTGGSSSPWTYGTNSIYYRSNVEVGTGNLFVDTVSSNVGVGTTTPAYTLDVNGDINFTGTFYQGGSQFVGSPWTSNVDTLYYNTSNVGIGSSYAGYELHVEGNVYATQDVSAFSDARFKENVEPIDRALEKVCSIGGYTYNKIGDPRRNAGVLAQEVMTVLPEVVHGSEDTNYSVSYGNMVSLLIEAIKELKLEVDELKKSK